MYQVYIHIWIYILIYMHIYIYVLHIYILITVHYEMIFILLYTTYFRESMNFWYAMLFQVQLTEVEDIYQLAFRMYAIKK